MTKKKSFNDFKLENHYFIAHRGHSENFPENTLIAFQASRIKGITGIEFDVQFSKDGVPVVYHDRHLKKCGRANQSVSDFKSDALKTMDAGSWFSHDFKGTPLLTLEELFHFLKHSHLYFFLELKVGKQKPFFAQEQIKRIFQLARQYNVLNKLWIISFNHDVLRYIRDIEAQVPLIWNVPPHYTVSVKGVHKLNVDGLGFDIGALHHTTVSMLTRYKTFSMTYTCNTKNQIQRALNTRCHFILSDRPLELQKFVTYAD